MRASSQAPRIPRTLAWLLARRWGAAVRLRKFDIRCEPMQRLLIILGLTTLLAGLLWPWLGKLPLGRLPGDIIIQRENFRLYFPLTTGVVLSLVLTLLLWIFRK